MMGINDAKENASKIEKHCLEERNAQGVKENIIILEKQIEKAVKELNNFGLKK